MSHNRPPGQDKVRVVVLEEDNTGLSANQANRAFEFTVTPLGLRPSRYVRRRESRPAASVIVVSWRFLSARTWGHLNFQGEMDL